ncbi:MBL fold metallo-hydrolase [Shimia sediminis]|uniref:MBL fold metallo-hydrolase n=1 Tax=Shimia sediminis TaxID=2497945 RepID=UPI000F8CDC9E|nr:MBL fold metallo-hydrolase [Shimia sediminis]
MTLTRRRLLQGAGASVGLAGLGLRPSFAANTATLGSMQIRTLSDGTLTLPPEFIFAPMPQDQLAPIRAEFGITEGPLTPECNVTLMQDGERTVLFDVGSGTGFQDSAGLLIDALDEAGVAPEEVTHVVFTHCHPDHLWGVLDDFDDPLFSEAQYMMGRAEWDYWWDPKTVDTIEAARTTMAIGAKRRMEMIEDAITLFDDGAEILPGVAARASYGHTPGHMAFELRQGSESVMVVGDAIGNHHVAFAAPGWESGSDQDGATAVATRQSLLDQLAADKTRLIGYHLPQGGMGHVERSGDTYRFVPDGA